jgi:broad specificity phosphatase PhoE
MYLIRHGQSEFNLRFSQTGRDPGIIDAPLTKRGVEQAEGAAKHFLSMKSTEQRLKAPKRIIASPYTRALQTAAPIAKALGLPITVNALLGERRLYSCDVGTELPLLKNKFVDCDFASVEKNNWWPAANESDDDIAARVHAFHTLENLAREEELGEALIVSHWYFIFTLSALDCENCQIVWRDNKGAFHRQ